MISSKKTIPESEILEFKKDLRNSHERFNARLAACHKKRVSYKDWLDMVFERLNVDADESPDSSYDKDTDAGDTLGNFILRMIGSTKDEIDRMRECQDAFDSNPENSEDQETIDAKLRNIQEKYLSGKPGCRRSCNGHRCSCSEDDSIPVRVRIFRTDDAHDAYDAYDASDMNRMLISMVNQMFGEF